jgi:hypothetical protein
MSILESDWKAFKKLREIALDRMYRRVLDECAEICTDESRSTRERYMALYASVQEHDKSIGNVFNQFSRSSASLSLFGMRSLELLDDSELEGLSEDMLERTEPLD